MQPGCNHHNGAKNSKPSPPSVNIAFCHFSTFLLLRLLEAVKNLLHSFVWLLHPGKRWQHSRCVLKTEPASQ